MVREGLADVREVAEAIAEMTGKPLIAPDGRPPPESAAGRSARRRASRRMTSASPRLTTAIVRRPPSEARPFVSIVLPAYNEQDRLPARPRSRDRRSSPTQPFGPRSSSPTTAAATAPPISCASAPPPACPRNVSLRLVQHDAQSRQGRRDPHGHARRRRAATSSSWTPISPRRPKTRLKLLDESRSAAHPSSSARRIQAGRQRHAREPARAAPHGRPAVHHDAEDRCASCPTSTTRSAP